MNNTFTPNGLRAALPGLGLLFCLLLTQAFVHAQTGCPNLVINGNFQAGNAGFTPGLPLGCNSCTAGTYCVTSNFTGKCSGWPSVFDHTTGTAAGLFLAIDGSTTGANDVWSVTGIPVTPGVTYEFSFWVATVFGPGQQTFDLGMRINGQTVAVGFISQAVGVWTRYSTSWVCPPGVFSVPLAIRQMTGGAFRDFGLDDIGFYCTSCSADFVVEVLGPCGAVQFINQSNGQQPHSSQWSFGDPNSGANNTSTLSNPSHQFSTCGTFNVCLTFSAGNGCADIICKPVTITDNIPPTALCQPGQGYDLNANCTLPVTVAMINAGSFDNCQIQSMSVSPAVVQGCGVFPITLTVTDWCGNTSTCATEIQTIEVTPPVIMCPPNVQRNCNTNLAPAFTGFATATDNCMTAPTIIWSDAVVGQMPCDGAVIRTWTATDACGNESTCVQTITVIDNVPPIAACRSSLSVVLGANCSVTITPAMIDNGSFDNCQIQSMTVNPSTFTQCGTFTVTLTVTDVCGNTATCTTSVQVTETVPPVIVCPPNVQLTCGGPTSPAATGFASATDNCSIPLVTFTDVVTGSQPCNQVIVRTWRATDDCGNTATCVQTITVMDDAAPVIVCPADVVVSATNPDSCTATINNLQLLSANDNCSTPLILYQVTGATSATGQNDASGLTFNTGVSTVTYTATDNCGNVSSCSFNVTVLCEEPCLGNIIENSNFSAGAIAGAMPLQGSMANWQAAYGTPVVSTDFGCGDPVYVELQGNRTHGSAIYQQLATPIQKGKVYELTVCVKSRACPSCISVPYVKMRGIAFNGTLPTTGEHPEPDSDVAIIGVSGRIAVCDDWTTFVFHRWRPGKSYNNIAISIENSEPIGANAISHGYIDNICFREVNDSIPCYLAELDSLGNLIPPFGQIDPTCPVLEDSVDVFMGAIDDIYAYCNPLPNGLDTWYETCPDSCESIGGELPQDLLDFIEHDTINQYMLDSLGTSDSVFMDDLNSFLDSLELAVPSPKMLDSIMNIGALSFNCINIPPMGSPPDDANSPFNGRDIVFVHGLRMDPITERLALQNAGSQTEWPADRAEFYNGYWKIGADNTWTPHTEKYLKTEVLHDLGNPGSFTVQRTGNFSNRYLVVTHPATQSFAHGAHAVMEQIANAMIDGTGVINCSPTEQRPTNTFGHNGYIIISHSDGAPLSDIVLTTSNLSQFPPLNLMLGDVSFIAERCELHVAIQGGFGGSNYASILLKAASTLQQQPFNTLAQALLNVNLSSQNWLFTSELRDMAITKHLWGNFIDQVPVCVLTLAGGHPTDYGEDIGVSHKRFLSYIGKHVAHHGFDDGVLSIDCQTANTDHRRDYPNVFEPKGLLKLYDMGIPRERANRYFLDQKIDVRSDNSKSSYASAACIPWISPTGMVQPVKNANMPGVPGFDALKRYNNHYSFIQSTADHYQGARGRFDSYPNYEETYDVGSQNCEESRVVTSRDVYDVCGVNASKLQQVEYVRGKSITFKIFKRTYTRWIWKRKYHVLKDFKSKNQLDYLYESVLK
jgi:PKD repeat protein